MAAKPEKSVTAQASEGLTLTLRDQFAIAALPRILATFRVDKMPNNPFEIAALSAYCIADAMLEARINNKEFAARTIESRKGGSTPDG
jgi:hypothetical protein